MYNYSIEKYQFRTRAITQNFVNLEVWVRFHLVCGCTCGGKPWRDCSQAHNCYTHHDCDSPRRTHLFYDHVQGAIVSKPAKRVQMFTHFLEHSRRRKSACPKHTQRTQTAQYPIDIFSCQAVEWPDHKMYCNPSYTISSCCIWCESVSYYLLRTSRGWFAALRNSVKMLHVVAICSNSFALIRSLADAAFSPEILIRRCACNLFTSVL